MRSETDSGESETKSNVRCGKVVSDAGSALPPRGLPQAGASVLEVEETITQFY